MGRERPELASNICNLPVGDHVVFFEPLPDGIDVVRVLHGRMDIEKRFREWSGAPPRCCVATRAKTMCGREVT